jgi:hypothetical protein
MSNRIADLKHELLAAAERQHEQHAAADAGRRRFARVLRAVRRRPGRTTLAFAAVAGAAAAALFVSSPWQTPPGFLERAQAALTSTEPSILHMKWDTWAGTVADCSPEEIWLDQQPPSYRYRFLVDEPRYFFDAGARKAVCIGEPPIEFGGTQTTFDTLEFRPPNMLVPVDLKAMFPVDPVANLREAIGAGRAHDEGTTGLDGRTVRRIRTDPLPSCPNFAPGCPRRPSYVYVDRRRCTR